jgi:hypothetical protein
MFTFQMNGHFFLFFYMELLPRVCLHHLVTLCILKAQFARAVCMYTGMVVPVLELGCIVPCVGNPADEKFYVFNKVPHMTLLGTIVHSLTKSIATARKSFT